MSMGTDIVVAGAGVGIDACATGHTMIRVNPALRAGRFLTDLGHDPAEVMSRPARESTAVGGETRA